MSDFPSPSAAGLTRRDWLRHGVGAASSLWALASAPSALGASSRTSEVPGFSRGHYASVPVEHTHERLRVRGSIPRELKGRHLRNGHNPKSDARPAFWFAGSGMVHGLRLADGQAQWYRNRWVDTPALHGAPLFRADHSLDLHASAAGTHVVAHAGRILALQEVNLPFEITPELATVGAHDFGGKLKANMTAHPKFDPATGEMVFISASPVDPCLTYHVVDRRGQLVHTEVVPGAGPSVMHDFALTPKHAVFFDTSVVFAPKSGLPFPYAWDERYPAKIGVLPRDRSKGGVKWISVAPYYAFHFSNAWDTADGRIIVEGTWWPEKAWNYTAKWVNGAPTDEPAVRHCRLARWEIDPAAGTARMRLLDDLSLDFVAIDPARATQEQRCTYGVAFPDASLKTAALVKFDHHSGRRQVHRLAPGLLPSEPSFAAGARARAEDEGWLLSFVSNLRTGRGELHILDATNLNKPAQAVVEIPSWVPAGVHGSWISDDELHPPR